MVPRLIVVCWLLIPAAVPAVGLPFPVMISADEIAADRAEEEYPKFLQAFRRRPRPGVSLDRIIEHHRDQGSLSQFAVQLEQQLEDQPTAADAALLGFVQQQLGAAEPSLQAFVRAAELAPQDSLFTWMRGQQLNRLGRSEEAAQVMLPLIAERLPVTDLMAIGRDLNSALRASGRSGELPVVWQKIEQSTGNNLRILEQTAWILRSEGLLAEAAQRFRRIAAETRDPEDALAATLRASAIMLELGQGAETRTELQTQLERVLPDSWQAGEIRRLLEDGLRQAGAAADLQDWYTELAERWPESISIPQRRVQLLDQAGNAEAADQLLADAIERLPSAVALVRLQIARLQQRGMSSDVDLLYVRLQQRQLLTNTDLRDWGQWQLQRQDLSVQQQRERALEIWDELIQRIGESRQELLLVAEMLQRAGMPVEAETIYERLLQEDAQDRELLTQYGEFLLQDGRREQALAIWSHLVGGDSATRANRLFLSELLESHGMPERSIALLREVCQERTEVSDVLRLVSLLRSISDPDEQLQREIDGLLQDATDAAETDQQREQIQEVWLRAILESGRGSMRVLELEEEVAGASGADGEKMLQLALLHRESGEIEAAIRWAEAALQDSATRARGASLLAELCDRTGALDQAVAALQILAETGADRSQVLVQIAELQLRLGRRRQAAESALQAAAAAGERIADLRAAIGVLQQADATAEAVQFLKRRRVAERGPDELAVDLAYLLVQRGEQAAAENVLWTILGRAGAEEFPEGLLPLLMEVSGPSAADGRLSARVEEMLAGGRRSAALMRLLVSVLEAGGDQAGAIVVLRRRLNDEPGSITDQLSLLRLLLQRGELLQAEGILAGISTEQLSVVQQSQLMALLLAFPQSGAVDDQLLNLLRISDDPQRTQDVLRRLFEERQYQRADWFTARLPAEAAATWELQWLQAVNAVCRDLPNAESALAGVLQSGRQEFSSPELRRNSPGELQLHPRALDSKSLNEWQEQWHRVVAEYRATQADAKDQVLYSCLQTGRAAARMIALMMLEERSWAIPAESVTPDELWMLERLVGFPLSLEYLLGSAERGQGTSGLLLFASLMDADSPIHSPGQNRSALSVETTGRLLRVLKKHQEELSIADERSVLEWLRARADGGPFLTAVRQIVDQQNTGSGDLLMLAIALGGQHESFEPLLRGLRSAVERNNAGQPDSRLQLRTADVIDECLLIVTQKSGGSVELEGRLELLRIWGINLPGRESVTLTDQDGETPAAAPVRQESAIPPGVDLISDLSQPVRRFLVLTVLDESNSGRQDIAEAMAAELSMIESRTARQSLLTAFVGLLVGDANLQLEALREYAEIVGETWGIRRVQLRILCERGDYQTAADLAGEESISEVTLSADRWLKTLEIAFLAGDQSLANRASAHLEGLQLTQQQQRDWMRGMRLAGQAKLYQEIAERQRVSSGLTELQLQLDELNMAISAGSTDTALALASEILQRPAGPGAIRVRNRRDQLELELRQRAQQVLQSAGRRSIDGDDQ